MLCQSRCLLFGHSNCTWREYKLRSTNLLLLHPSLVQISSSAPCSQTPLVCVPVSVSHSYRTTGKIVALHIMGL
jgi:hypothetical protein